MHLIYKLDKGTKWFHQQQFSWMQTVSCCTWWQLVTCSTIEEQLFQMSCACVLWSKFRCAEVVDRSCVHQKLPGLVDLPCHITKPSSPVCDSQLILCHKSSVSFGAVHSPPSPQLDTSNTLKSGFYLSQTLGHTLVSCMAEFIYNLIWRTCAWHVPWWGATPPHTPRQGHTSN